MRSTFLLLLTLFLTSYLILLLDTAHTRAFSAGPDPGVTGGFNEPRCNHTGFPKQYEPGKTYPIKLAGFSNLPTDFALNVVSRFVLR